MNFNQLIAQLLCYCPDREFLLYEAGIKGFFHLGESGQPGFHLIDATPAQVMAYARRQTLYPTSTQYRV